MDLRRLVFTALLAACSSGGGESDSRDSMSEITTVPAATTDVDPTSTGDASTAAGSESGTETTAAATTVDATTGPAPTTGTPDETTGSTDETTSAPPPPAFEPGHVFVVGFNDRLVFEYDAALEPVGSWSHVSFDDDEGPAGMVFDYRGYLVVAAYAEFCVFSGPNEVETCYPKIKEQRTENVIFDIFRNLYTTTSTGGTAEIHKYNGEYQHQATFSLPTMDLTGITCDPDGDLFVASQNGATSIIYKVSREDLSVLDSFDVQGNAEGLQYAPDNSLLVALSGGVGIASVVPSSPSMVLSVTADPGLLWPVPLTLDQAGNRYTGDFEDGNGNAPSDLFVFAPDGAVVASRRPSELHGPFGMVVAGTSLPCGALPPG